MIRETVSALLACLVTFVLCVVAYPAAVWGLGQLTFPRQAEGSLIYDRDRNVIGSDLVAQPFASEKYFQPRPSAVDYKADAAGGSNLGTKNPDLRKKIEERAAALKATEKDPVPVDLVTASGGGLDPHISPEAAYYQAARVAAARKLPVDRIRGLIDAHVERSGAFLGAPPRVNVLLLNLDLDKEAPAAASAASTAETSADSSAITVAAKPDGPAEPSPAAPAAETKPSSSAPAHDGGGQPTTIDALTRRLDRIEESVGSAPTESLAAEVKDIKGRVAKLADATGDADHLVGKLKELDERVAGVDRDLRALRSEVQAVREPAATGSAETQLKALRAEVDSLRASIKKDEAVDRGSRTSRVELDLGRAVRLFQGKQYAEASSAFRALAQGHPDDARAWYFAAIANGLATRHWRGETEQLVNKGVERERAGTPGTAEIDAAFAELTKDNGREWLSFFRHRAAKR